MDRDRLGARTMSPRPVLGRTAGQPANDRVTDADSVGRYRRACRDAETARLLLAELGRWHGPMA